MANGNVLETGLDAYAEMGHAQGPMADNNGRNYQRLTVAVIRVVEALNYDDTDDITEIMRSGFEDMVAGFGADRAALLVPEVGGFKVIETNGLRREHQETLAKGESTHGISGSYLRDVLRTGKPFILEHPSHLAASARETTAIPRTSNYSVLIGPLLHPREKNRVDALYYFQTQGVENAYMLPDLVFLTTYLELLKKMREHHIVLSEDPYITGTHRDVEELALRKAIMLRLERFDWKMNKVQESLGLERGSFYRILERLKIPNKREAVQKETVEKIGELAGEPVEVARAAEKGKGKPDLGGDE